MTNSNQQEIIDVGLAPADPRESVILTDLTAGAYTAIVTGIDGTTNNIALVEVFDLNSLNTPQLLNISTRGFVETGDAVMIAGTIIGGVNPKAIVIRGLGPSLATAGVSNFLPNPTISVVNSLGVTIAADDDWQTDPGASEIQSVGLAPTNTLESATLLDLFPGNYTAILSDVNGNSGVGLVEIYNVSP